MDRIRAGLTGLAAVFLVTAAASLLFAPDEAQTIAADAHQPGEPLAQLGVAPGSDKGATGQAHASSPGASPPIATPSNAPAPNGPAPNGPAPNGLAPNALAPNALAPNALAPEPLAPGVEAQPSGGLPVPGAGPALPSSAGSGGRPDPDRPVAI